MKINASKMVTRRLVASALVAMSMGVTGAVVSAPVQASAAACTDNATTRDSFVLYGKYVELRQSGNCGGVSWFRMNLTGNIQGAAEITLQYRGRDGVVRNGPSQSTNNNTTSWVSSYVTGQSSVRLIIRNLAGGQPDSNRPWVGQLSNARVAD